MSRQYKHQDVPLKQSAEEKVRGNGWEEVSGCGVSRTDEARKWDVTG
jgi:hypothetical protein